MLPTVPLLPLALPLWLVFDSFLMAAVGTDLLNPSPMRGGVTRIDVKLDNSATCQSVI